MLKHTNLLHRDSFLRLKFTHQVKRIIRITLALLKVTFVTDTNIK